MEIILNKCYGGFGISDEAMDMYFERTGRKISRYCNNLRNDPILISIVKDLGTKANGSASKLVVVDIPDGLDYVIDEYDGIETLHERVTCW